QSCTEEQLINTYDNSIRYTDHILGEVIDMLDKASDRFDTALLYASDHGESLGEGGIYLHGLPYMFAPAAQTHIPTVFWASPAYREAASLDKGCLARNAGLDYSHDNLFHSVLGLFDIKTDVYRTDLDIFAPCRPAERTAVLMGGPETDGSALR
ncbi:MAG: sulfatase-like hydrolase/transferase, partial [Parvibaculum sp.]